MSETGELLRRGVAELLEAVVSLRFRARRLVNDHPGDWDLTRAVDALDERASALVAAHPAIAIHHGHGAVSLEAIASRLLRGAA